MNEGYFTLINENGEFVIDQNGKAYVFSNSQGAEKFESKMDPFIDNDFIIIFKGSFHKPDIKTLLDNAQKTKSDFYSLYPDTINKIKGLAGFVKSAKDRNAVYQYYNQKARTYTNQIFEKDNFKNLTRQQIYNYMMLLVEHPNFFDD